MAKIRLLDNYPGKLDVDLVIMSWIRKKGMTVHNGAKAFGMSYPTLNRRLNHPDTFTVDELRRIGKTINVPAGRLIEILLGI